MLAISEYQSVPHETQLDMNEKSNKQDKPPQNILPSSSVQSAPGYTPI